MTKVNNFRGVLQMLVDAGLRGLPQDDVEQHRRFDALEEEFGDKPLDTLTRAARIHTRNSQWWPSIAEMWVAYRQAVGQGDEAETIQQATARILPLDPRGMLSDALLAAVSGLTNVHAIKEALATVLAARGHANATEMVDDLWADVQAQAPHRDDPDRMDRAVALMQSYPSVTGGIVIDLIVWGHG